MVGRSNPYEFDSCLQKKSEFLGGDIKIYNNTAMRKVDVYYRKMKGLALKCFPTHVATAEY